MLSSQLTTCVQVEIGVKFYCGCMYARASAESRLYHCDPRLELTSILEEMMMISTIASVVRQPGPVSPRVSQGFKTLSPEGYKRLVRKRSESLEPVPAPWKWQAITAMGTAGEGAAGSAPRAPAQVKLFRAPRCLGSR